MVRSIEQILGLPPMNVVDATALPMFECFCPRAQPRALPQPPQPRAPRPPQPQALSKLTGAARRYGRPRPGRSSTTVDGGRDDVMNRIIWFCPPRASSPIPRPSLARPTTTSKRRRRSPPRPYALSGVLSRKRKL
ncbi:MAG: hypothetical protein WKG07_11470 [Hymenobacter sp.]